MYGTLYTCITDYQTNASKYIVSTFNYRTSVTSIKKLIHHSPIRCATAELYLQSRYDDSVTGKYKIQIKKTIF